MPLETYCYFYCVSEAFYPFTIHHPENTPREIDMKIMATFLSYVDCH